jgi:diacylglycerol O-acyltransferase 1
MPRISLSDCFNFRPILNNSITPIKEFHLAKIIERLLKLSTVSLVAWLAGFFCIFHSTLNALAEVMHFADRKFYDAWWNSGSMGAYWRLWNIPVHGYFKRHVYIPLKRRGWSNSSASTVVFILSAVIHEILLGVPTHAVISLEIVLIKLIGVAFLAMLGQIPLVFLTEPLEKMRGSGTTIGNCIFWVSFCLVGQPFGALYYFYRFSLLTERCG